MPLTLFAHQVPTMAMKLRRPTWFDGTALCIGSMAPDMGYAVSSYLHVDTHGWDGFWRLDLPLTIVFTLIVRWSTASVAAAHLPDLGGFRLWSWRVIHRRPPALWLTLLCCALGVGTHIALDSFTHPGRPGVRLLGYQHLGVQLWGHTEPLAGVFQLIGHTFGSAVGLWLLLVIGKRHLLEAWYGMEQVDAARHFTVTMAGRAVFWACVVGGIAAGLWWGRHLSTMVGRIERPLFCGAIGAMAAALLPVCRPRPLTSPVPARHTPVTEPQR